MRVSIYKTDSGYENFTSGSYNWEVWLNGGIIDNVVTADEEMGLVIAQTRTVDGKILLNEACDVVLKTLRGRVEIIRSPYERGELQPK